jgi:DNA helicase HerA-like ATPase
MDFVIGRDSGPDDGPVASLGNYRALDGSEGAPIYLDLDGPHSMLIVGKRGYGKSYTLGVLAEALAGTRLLAPVIIDPMDVYTTLSADTGYNDIDAEVISNPSITASAVEPQSWCALLELSPESAVGGLVWQAASEAGTLDGMRTHIQETEAPDVDKRAALNHLQLAERWDIFDPNGLTARDLCTSTISVIDVSGMDEAPMNAIVRGIAEELYHVRVTEQVNRLPWLLIDEAHTFFNGIAEPALQTILTRGRAPGVSLVLATQRPSAIPEVGISQSDVLISHRLTSHADLEALRKAQPTYMETSLDERMPTEPGEVIVIDDSTETVHAVQIRERKTPHGGSSPSASDMRM